MPRICFIFLFSLILSSCNKKDADLRALIASNEAMENVSKSLDDDHEQIRRSIEGVYRDRGERLKEKIVKDKADSVRTSTKNLLNVVSSMKEDLIKSSGGLDESGIPEAYSKNVSVTPDQSKNLKTNLSAWYSRHGSSLKNTEDTLNVFIVSQAENIPLVLHLINLSNLQWKILKLESPLLAKLMTEIDFDPVGKFKNIKVSVSAYSNIVEEGQEYIADVSPFYISDSKTFVKEVKMSGQSFPIDSNGIGKISFVAKADKFNKEGLSKKTWNGSITLGIRGRDSTFAFTEEYFVKKRCTK